MANDSAVTVYRNTAVSDLNNKDQNSFSVKVGLAQRLSGGAIIHVTNVDQKKIAESAGACCVIVSEPSRMLDPAVIKQIQESVPIPVMAKARVGHFIEAQILEAVGVDYIDENELFPAADDANFTNKHNFRVPFVCGCQDLGDGLRRVREGAPYDIVAQIKQIGRLPVVHFASGGIITPADAAMMMQLGCNGVFVDAEAFDCSDPYKRVCAIVQAVRNYNDVHMLTGLNLRDTEGSY
ncbi:hypothetical protein L1987_45193 [Smallanthus sonchifolius]|uniref:Uncharacterized protein n=1 Tax=Smallanthus sonchifolius TaxID=185202 RepID=A0ACB9GS77_9ASTR|nr:hypothetical protein L1987_45193 [Smallanthus sonchifolius]